MGSLWLSNQLDLIHSYTELFFIVASSVQMRVCFQQYLVILHRSLLYVCLFYEAFTVLVSK